MTSTLVKLAGRITEKTALVSHFLGSQAIKNPSFDEGSYAAYSGENTDLRQARYELAQAALDLYRLAQGPEDHILQLAWSVGVPSSPAL